MKFNFSKIVEEQVKHLSEKHDMPAEEIREMLDKELSDQLEGDHSKEFGYDGPQEQLQQMDDAWERPDGVVAMSRRDEKVCDTCFEHDGTYYSLDEALEQQPLPHDGCTNDQCRCDYHPVLDEEAEDRH